MVAISTTVHVLYLGQNLYNRADQVKRFVAN